MTKSLEREGLLSFALGTAVEPPYPVSGDAEEIRLFYRWKEFNNACETAILASLGKSQLGFVTTCRSAAEMWSRLQNLYQHSSEVNIVRLEDELQNLKWKRNTPLETYLQEIDRVAEALRGCGQEVSDSRLRITLIRGLPDKLDNIKHILLQLGPQPYHIICDYLRSHVLLSSSGDGKAYLGAAGKTPGEQKKKPKASDNSGASTDSTASKAANSGKTCTYCKNSGHSVDECRKKKRRAETVCHTCKQKGHYANECKNQGSEKEVEGSEPATTMLVMHKGPRSQPEVRPAANLTIQKQSRACLADCGDKEDWILDSGATQHMSHEMDLLSKTTNPVGLEVHLGNSAAIPVKAKGELNLRFHSGSGKHHLITLKDVLGVPELSKNLLSVSACMKNGFSVLFDHETMDCRIFNKDKVWAGARMQAGGLWVLDCEPVSQAAWACKTSKGSSQSEAARNLMRI